MEAQDEDRRWGEDLCDAMRAAEADRAASGSGEPLELDDGMLQLDAAPSESEMARLRPMLSDMRAKKIMRRGGENPFDLARRHNRLPTKEELWLYNRELHLPDLLELARQHQAKGCPCPQPGCDGKLNHKGLGGVRKFWGIRTDNFLQVIKYECGTCKKTCCNTSPSLHACLRERGMGYLIDSSFPCTLTKRSGIDNDALFNMTTMLTQAGVSLAVSAWCAPPLSNAVDLMLIFFSSLSLSFSGLFFTNGI